MEAKREKEMWKERDYAADVLAAHEFLKTVPADTAYFEQIIINAQTGNQDAAILATLTLKNDS